MGNDHYHCNCFIGCSFDQFCCILYCPDLLTDDQVQDYMLSLLKEKRV